jgi:O-antigen/teichoic acid export membrane protein/SAM-dependent methyltransferase
MSPELNLDPAREERELRDYLGSEYDRNLLERYQQTLDREFEACGDEERFYRTSRGYLYNLTAFAMTGTKLPYLRELVARVPPASRVLDYGCGIGSDGLLLLEQGYRVEFADFENPSTEFLRWRLRRRNLAAPIHDLDADVPGGFDLAYAFDVIEHVPDPFAFLGEMERRAALVLVNLLEPEPGDQALHRELPIQRLLRHAADRGIVSYAVHHGRSHLVLYSSRAAAPQPDAEPDEVRAATAATPVREAVVEGQDAVEGLETLERTTYEGRFELEGRGLREHTARGVLVNAAFQVGFAGLSLFQRFAVAIFLTTTEYAIWGIVLTTLLTLSALKQVGITDKFIQQDEPDQELAFQKAFTLEFIFSSLMTLLIVVLLPLYALVYQRTDILLPGAVLALALVGSALYAPLWIPYRQMRFVRQRTLEAINPIVSTVVMIALAAAGAGYWSLVIGILAGTFGGAAAVIATSPYRLRFRFDRGTLREYVGFSWPLLVGALGGLVVVQGTTIVANYAVGIVGLGALVLASNLIVFGDRVDRIISRTIYPAVAAVKSRVDLMFETFVKSNRLALMWGLPFGVGFLLFAPDLVEFVIGERWRPAETLLQGLGLIIGIGQFAFNWGVFIQVTGRTRPLAVSGVISVITFAVLTAPFLFAFGLDGYIAGVGLSLAVQLAVRGYYLSRLFEGFSVLRHFVRAVAPVLPAAAAIVLVRLLTSGVERTFEVAAAEFGLYVLVTVLATWFFERSLISEILGYLRGRRGEARPALA